MKKILFLFLILLISVPVFAVEYKNGEFRAKVYGELYADGFYSYENDGNTGKNNFGSKSFIGSSLLGAEIGYEHVSGVFEASLADPVKNFYINYNFNGDEDHYILIGKDEIIAAYTFGQVSNDLGGLSDYGTITDATRRLQLRYGIKGFEMAIIIPSLGGGWSADYTDDTGYKLGNERFQPFNVIPRLELAYTYSNDFIDIKTFGGYAAYLYRDNTNAAADKFFHSYYIGVGGQANFNNSFLFFTAWYGANLDLTDALSTYKSRSVGVGSDGKISMFLEDGSKAETIQSAGAAVGIGHTFHDKFTPQIGVGYTANFGEAYGRADERIGAYINCVFQINEWFAITPEIAYMDYLYDSHGNKKGYDILAGALASLIF